MRDALTVRVAPVLSGEEEDDAKDSEGGHDDLKAAFLAGQVPIGFQLLPNVLGMLGSGAARPLAVTSEKRMTALPDVPTAAEAGVKNYETGAWLALLAPPGTPKPIVDTIYKALAAAVKEPAVKERFVQQGAEPVSPGPEELAKFMKSETIKLRDIIQKAGIEPM